MLCANMHRLPTLLMQLRMKRLWLTLNRGPKTTVSSTLIPVRFRSRMTSWSSFSSSGCCIGKFWAWQLDVIEPLTGTHGQNAVYRTHRCDHCSRTVVYSVIKQMQTDYEFTCSREHSMSKTTDVFTAKFRKLLKSYYFTRAYNVY